MAYDIRMAKLVTGEIAIGKFDAKASVINDPAVLQTVPTQQGVQMVLLPFGYPFETEISGSIKGEHILYTFKNFPEELKNKYLEATSNLTISSARDLNALNRMAGGGKSGSGLILK